MYRRFRNYISQKTGSDRRVLVLLSVGDLADRATIANIKAVKIAEPHHVAQAQYLRSCLPSEIYEPEVFHLYERLENINKDLWSLEDHVRAARKREANSDHVRSICFSIIEANDERTKIKAAIDVYFGITSVEEKKYL